MPSIILFYVGQREQTCYGKGALLSSLHLAGESN